jgi:hypothetical protein
MVAGGGCPWWWLRIKMMDGFGVSSTLWLAASRVLRLEEETTHKQRGGWTDNTW